MRLYSTSNATQVDDPQFGRFTAGPNGEFDFPDELSARLHPVHVGKVRQWESDDERVKRIQTEELDSVRDPATLLAAVKNIGSGQNALVAALLKMLNVDPSTVAQDQAPAPAAPAVPADQAPAAEERTDQTPAQTSIEHAAADADSADEAPAEQAATGAAKKSAAAKK